MTKHEHTPGPWFYDEATRYIVPADGFTAEGSVPIAKVEIQEPPEADEEPITLANGYLLTAAPELLSGLQWALKYVRMPEGVDAEEFARHYNAAQDAIANATVPSTNQ